MPENEPKWSISMPCHAMPTRERTKALRAIINATEEAVSLQNKLALSYADQFGTPTAQMVRPLDFWYWGKVWTLVAWCELRTDFRMFRLDCIAPATSAGRYHAEPGRTLQDFYAQQSVRNSPPRS